MAATNLDVGALYGALDRQRISRNLTWRDMARSLDLSPSTFTRMAQGSRPDADALLTLVGWLGVPAETFATEGSQAASTEAEPVSSITSYLRASAKVSSEEAEALSNIIAAAYTAIVKEK